MTIKIGILGLGHIGYYHITALQNLSEYQLIAACDLNPELQKLLSEDVTFYTNVNEFLANEQLETVIIATPNLTHFELGCSAFKAGKNIIMEKPAAMSMEKFDILNGLFKKNSSLHIYYAFHAAKAFEVTWFKKYYLQHDNLKNLGPITSFSCTFYDPYWENGQINKKAIHLGNSWIDSGVNALSVLSEFINPDDLCVVAMSETSLSSKVQKIQALVHFDFPVLENQHSGMGIVNTNWTMGINLKKTYLYFAYSGSCIELDHSNQKILLNSGGNKKKLLYDFSESGPRLYNHYIGVFTDYSQCRRKNTFNTEIARKIHGTLFQAENWRTH